MNIPYLTILLLIPLVGAAFIFLFARGKDKELVAKNAKYTALWTSIFTFLFSLALLFNFDIASTQDYQFTEKHNWIENYNIFYFVISTFY